MLYPISIKLANYENRQIGKGQQSQQVKKPEIVGAGVFYGPSSLPLHHTGYVPLLLIHYVISKHNNLPPISNRAHYPSLAFQ